MRQISLLIITLLFLNVSFSQAQQEAAPLSTKNIMDKALKKAKKQDKNVFIIFHASWCGWCKKMDASMNDTMTKAFFDDNYIVEHLVVKESKDKLHLENPGGAEFLTKYGGDRSGIPYWLIFDSKGELLADSKMLENENIMKGRGSNIGCPGTEPEVNAFLFKLKKTSNLTEEDLAIIAERFRKNSSR